MDNVFYLSPQMIIMATAQEKDFSLLPEYLQHKAGEYLTEAGLIEDGDDLQYECVNHLSPDAFDLQTSTIIRMVKAIAEWETARSERKISLIENKASAILAHALHASGMAHHDLTTEQAEESENTLREIISKRKADIAKAKAGIKASERSQEKAKKEQLVVEEYQRLCRTRPGEERSFAAMIARKVGYKDPRNVRDIIKKRIKT